MLIKSWLRAVSAFSKVGKFSICKNRPLGLILFALLLSPLSDHAAVAQAPKAKSGAHLGQHPAAHAPAHAAPAGASNAQVTAYLNRLRSKLIGAWLLPDGNNHVTLTGNFNQDGLSDNLKANSSPKVANAEDAALQAFNKCMPLEAMPTGMANAKLTVEFISNADPHGDSKSSINLRLDPVKQEAPPKNQSGQAEPAKTEGTQGETNTPPAQQ